MSTVMRQSVERKFSLWLWIFSFVWVDNHVLMLKAPKIQFIFCCHIKCLFQQLGAKKNKGPSFKIASVSINAQALLKSEEDLKPLAEAVPEDKEQRKKWVRN